MKGGKLTQPWLVWGLGLVLGVLAVYLVLQAFQKSEGFQSANAPQLLCAMEFAKQNPATVTNAALKTYVAKFNLAEAKQKQNVRTDANWMLRKVQADKMIAPMNAYYGQIRGRKQVLDCMNAAYAIPSKK